MSGLNASEIAKLLVEYGQRLSLKGGSPYRSKAYLRAAESLLTLTEPLGNLLREHRLKELPGIGDGISEMITRMYEAGTHPTLEKMRSEMPAEALELLSIPGLRPDKVLKIHQAGITSLPELERAAKTGSLASVRGLGQYVQRKVIQGLATRKAAKGRRHIHRAAVLLEIAQANLRKSHPELTRIVPAGDFRRGCELVGDLCLVAEAKVHTSLFGDVTPNNELKVAVSSPKNYGASLLFATGSAVHLDQLKSLAAKKGLVLTAEGLFRGRSNGSRED